MKAYCVLDDYSKDAVQILTTAGISISFPHGAGRPGTDELKKLVKNFDILIIGAKEQMTNEVYRECSSLKYLCTLSIGIDHIDRAFFESKEIKVINCTDSNVVSVAEHTIGLILALLKDLKTGHESSLSGLGRKGLPFMPRDIQGKTVGVLGAGKIAKEVIKLAQCFHTNIICNTLHPEVHTELIGQVKFVEIQKLFLDADILTIHVPLTDATRSLIGIKELALMKNDAILINTARLEIFNVNELVVWLKTKALISLGLDIDVDGEVDLLKALPNNSIVTPHIAGISNEAIARMDVEVAKKLSSFI
ncbi:3-phosphoglycerate dehydrogenase [Spirochaetia bacterium]|nr:3-phosphoglycerate dehydrogenase [Spirochaetia bacterium]